MTQPWQERFAAFRNKSDDEIRSQVQTAGGYAALLEPIFTGLAGSIDPGRAPGATLSYRLSDEGAEHAYSIVVEQPAARVENGASSSARITYSMTAADFVRMLSGEIDGGALYQSGKVTIDGDLSFALEVQGLFGSRT